jgi:hypothetical protein
MVALAALAPLVTGSELVGGLVFALVPLVALALIIYRLADIAENTARIADALERMERDRDRDER